MGFKVGDRVRLKEHYGDAAAGSEGTVVHVVNGVLLSVDSLMTKNGGIYDWRFELAEPKDSPRVGDVVRVVLEGKVTYVSDYGFDVASENTIPHSGAEHVKSVEILKPAKPSAAGLPCCSVVVTDDGLVLVRREAAWHGTDGMNYTNADVDRMGWTELAPKASE